MGPKAGSPSVPRVDGRNSFRAPRVLLRCASQCSWCHAPCTHGWAECRLGLPSVPPTPRPPRGVFALSLLGPQQAHNLPQVGAFRPALDLRCWINPQTWPLFPVSPEMFGEGPGGSPWSNVPAVWPVWLLPPPDSSHPSLTRVQPETALRPFPRGCLPEAASQGLVTVMEAPWLH